MRYCVAVPLFDARVAMYKLRSDLVVANEHRRAGQRSPWMRHVTSSQSLK